MTIDINCDLGESFGIYKIGSDEAIMPFISSANIACGFHAGDPKTILNTVLLAIKNNVAIGAHPGYPDLEGFGRREMKLDNEEIRASILYQAGAIKSIAETCGGRLQHVKPHGALYNAASFDYNLAMVIAGTIKDIDSSLMLFGLAGSEMIRAAAAVGLAFASEFFADRAYNDDGTLVSRNLPGAVIIDTSKVVVRAVNVVNEKVVETISGKTISVNADTICIHGESKMALEHVQNLAKTFRSLGIDLLSIGKR
jgi:UPF0271 protein